MSDHPKIHKSFNGPSNIFCDDHERELKDVMLPHSLVWTPIPVITWLLPFIGHMGVTTSRGTIYDFAAPYHVGIDDMAFGGKPIKYYPIKLDRGEVCKAWDEAICSSSREYNDYHVHNLFLDNCHSHVALCLNTFIASAELSNIPKDIKSRGPWTVPKLAFLMFVHGRYVTWHGFLKTWFPFCFIIIFIFVMIYVSKVFLNF